MLLGVFRKAAVFLKCCNSSVLFLTNQFCAACVFVEAIVSSGKTEKSPHDQEIKFFAKVSDSLYLIQLSSP